MVEYIDGFLYVEPSFYSWDEAYLIIVDDFSDVFLDSIHQHFIEYFCIDVHKEYGSVVQFLSCIFVWLGYQSDWSRVKRVWQCPFCFYCAQQFEEYWY
ncbi:hypothetical protein H671_2g7050 [Cricetulus griseus]|uniref:Uncharacterized protein n=1 Tax=Cricetulus griseus TaxID=10029 RepID=A0A061ICB2_CRIGR|nr:hypothetical protein H671_2g7050 [Cricetulus griseus]